MQLYPGAYRIQSLFGDRNLFQYLLVGENVVLVDTGIATTPEAVIFPYLDSLGLAPARLTLAITTHSDVDHQGGNHAIKRLSPGTWLACGEADRALVEDPRTLYDVRYNFMREEHGVGFEADPPPDAGKARKMDVTFSGGERIRLRDDWALEVLHVPGHSHGHLTLYDRKHRAAFVGDAIHGRGCPKAAGRPFHTCYLLLRGYLSFDVAIFRKPGPGSSSFRALADYARGRDTGFHCRVAANCRVVRPGYFGKPGESPLGPYHERVD